MTDSFDWQGRVGDNWASEWARTDRSFAGLQAVLVDRIAALGSHASRVLDVGCGAGATTLAVAERLPDAQCLGIDLSPALIETASRLRVNPRCRFTVADATNWADAAFVPDLLASRHGVMFFDDPDAAFAHLGDVSAPDAQLVFTCFRGVADNYWASSIMALLPSIPAVDPLAPGPFAFADRDRVSAILARSGWHDAEAEPLDWDYVAGAGSDPVTDAMAFFRQIGPAARAAAALEGIAREEFLAGLERLLHHRLSNGTVSFDAAAWLWTARRSRRSA